MPPVLWGEELYFDATKVEAYASIDSTRSRSLLGGFLSRAREFSCDTAHT